MKKRLLSLLLVLVMVVSMLNVGSISTAASVDSIIENRIYALYDLLGNKYFNVGQNTACSPKHSGHSCNNCLTSNIVTTTWFKNLFGNVSVQQFANQYGNGVSYTRAGYSCLGFANFAEWYIFKSSNSDTISTTNQGTYDLNYNNVSQYAKIGDILRLGNGHSVIFISASSSGIYVLDSNWSGSYNCLVTMHNISYSSYSYFTISRATNRDSVSGDNPSNPECSHSYYVDYEAVHPHNETMICSKCGNSYYTGNIRCEIGVNKTHPHKKYYSCAVTSCDKHMTYTGDEGYYISYNKSHPHKYYYVCEVTSCYKHMTYTGEVGTQTAISSVYPYNEYYVCPDTTCSYHNTNTGKNQIPGKPAFKGLKASYYSDESIVFSWDAVENTTHYNISQKKLVNGKYESLDTIFYATSGESYSYEPGEYRVLLQARNSNYSTEDGSTWLYTNGDWVDFTVKEKPKAPTNVQAVPAGSRVTVSWTASTNAEKYDVYLVQAPWSWESIKYSTSTTNTTVAFTDVADGDYKTFVIARPNSDSVQSEWIPITVKAEIPQAPVASASASYIREDSEITISWEPVDGAAYYRYYLTEYPEDLVYTTNTENGYIYDGTSITFNTLKNGRYNFFVRACNSEGYSPRCEWVRFDVYKDDYIPVKTTVFNGHIYALYDDEMSWSFARDLSANMGGHLVTITSKEESDFVTSLIQEGTKDAYWLGASNYENKDGAFTWVTGEAFNFEKWDEGQPTGSTSSGVLENFVEIRKSYSNNWNDVSNTNKTNKGFIVEIEPSESDIGKSVRYHGSEYLLIDRTATWMDAKLYCEMLGGHLVAINTVDEETVVNALIDQGTRSWYYVGATQKDGTWYWLDDTLFDDIKWSDKATDWYQKYQLLMKYKFDKTYLPFRNCYYPATNLSHTGFVCEIALPKPDVTLSTVNGAQIRTTGAQGLRFISSIDKTSIDFDRVVEYGTILIPSGDISDISELQIGATLNGHAVAKVVANYLYAEDDESVTYTAVITNIAEKNYAREYTARAYAILDDGSVVYADEGASRSIYAVAKRGLENPNESDANKELFQSIVDTVEGGN